MGVRQERGFPETKRTAGASFDETIDFIIGLPPLGPTDDAASTRINRVIHNSMPLVHIQPGIPSFTEGIDLMSRSPAFNTAIPDLYGDPKLDALDNRRNYVQLLAELGFGLKQGAGGKGGYLTCAYLADNFPTDTFTNEYGENFLQKITNVASEGLGGLSQMMGGRSFTEAIRKMGGAAQEAGERRGGKTGAAVGFAGGVVRTVEEQLAKVVAMTPEGSMIRKMAANVNVMLAGGRIDFPMLWKNSTYSPSYSMTIRLYNPNPNSRRATAKYIIGPIAALLLLGLPQSAGTGAYSWPFIHEFWSPGIYRLDPGYIANITIVKGGDQQQISWKQRLGVVDVRIDFGSVYNSILSAASSSRSRPTLKGYLEVLADEKSDVHGLTDFSRENNEENQSPADLRVTKNTAVNAGGLTNAQISNYQQNRAAQRKDQATTQGKTQMDITEPGETITARVASDIKDIADNLTDLIPTGIKISF